jgi:hypothetical protein
MPWAEDSRAAFRLVRSFIHKIVEDAPPLPEVAALTLPAAPEASSP